MWACVYSRACVRPSALVHTAETLAWDCFCARSPAFINNSACFCPGIIPNISNYFQHAPDWSTLLLPGAHVLTGSTALGLEQFDVLMLCLVFSVEVLDVALHRRSNILVCYQRRRTGSLDVLSMRRRSPFVCGPFPAGARCACDRDI